MFIDQAFQPFTDHVPLPAFRQMNMYRIYSIVSRRLL